MGNKNQTQHHLVNSSVDSETSTLMNVKSSCLTIIVDNAPDKTKGHFHQLTQDVIESFERNRKNCILFTQNSSINIWFKSRQFDYVELRYLSESDYSSIFGELNSQLTNSKRKNIENLHILILRSNRVYPKDFEYLELLSETIEKIDLRVLTNVSGMLSNTKEGAEERRIIERFRSLRVETNFLAWDQRVIGNPDFADTRFLPEAKESIRRNYFPNESTVGFYGKLSSERGLFQLLLAVFLNPKLKFRIMGYGFNRKYLYRSRTFVSLRKTPISAGWSLVINYLATLALKFKRVTFQEKYFEGEADMAREFQNCSALFFSCTNSPYSSGIVYQSLASNVPVAGLTVIVRWHLS